MSDLDSSDDELFTPLCQERDDPDTSGIRRRFDACFTAETKGHFQISDSDDGELISGNPPEDRLMIDNIGPVATAENFRVTPSKRSKLSTTEDDLCLSPRTLGRSIPVNFDELQMCSKSWDYPEGLEMDTAAVVSSDPITDDELAQEPLENVLSSGGKATLLLEIQPQSEDLSEQLTPDEGRTLSLDGLSSSSSTTTSTPHDEEILKRSTETADQITGGTAIEGNVERVERTESEDHTIEAYLTLCGEERQFLENGNLQCPQNAGSSGDNPADDFDFFGLGADVRREVYSTFKINAGLHEWQRDVLRRHVLEAKGQDNILILAPTSGGKTLVAIILLLRAMLIDGKDAIFTLPYVAIVTEKLRELRALASKLNTFSALEYAGNKGHLPVPRQKLNMPTLYVATPEKALGVWKSLCTDGERMQEIGMAVFDEFHMISDGTRGAVLEELVVSMLHWSGGVIRLCALSATVGNPELLRDFLGGGQSVNSTIHHVTKRPQAINEFMVVAGSQVSIRRGEDGRGEIDFVGERRKVLQDDDRLADVKLTMFGNLAEDRIVAKLVFQSMERGRPVLVFCNTRKRSADMCSTLTKAYHDVYRSEEGDGTSAVQTQRNYLIGHLQQESKGMVDKVLLHGIRVGIGMHTAALHPTERQAVEDAFRKGIITALCCTSTLAAGVNLPASRIIIRSPWTVDQFVPCSRYLQQIGRAGRGGGEVRQKGCNSNEQGDGPDSYIMLQPHDVSRFEVLLQKHVESVTSQLQLQPTFYKRTITMQVGILESTTAAERYSGRTYSGITRIVLSALELGALATLSIGELIDFYQLTLLYQNGVEGETSHTVKGSGSEVTGTRNWTVKPLLCELQDLLKTGYVELMKAADGSDNSVTIEIMVNVKTPIIEVPLPRLNRPAAGTAVARTKLTSEETECVLQALAEACERETQLRVNNYSLRLTTFTMAASAACISLEDARRFDKEADGLSKSICLVNPLVFLFLSITTALSKPLTDAGPHGGIDTATLIDTKIASVYHKHPDREVFEQLGLPRNIISLWVLGSSKVRGDAVISSTLTRIWSASFMMELCRSPDKFEIHCQDYGFDRGMALELASLLASRCGNLRKFCIVSERHWWYPPLSSRIIADLTDAAKDELVPLLALKHVTPGRAKVLVGMGIRTVRDVATVDNPTQLAESIKYLGKWRATEMVFDARVQLAHAAMILKAESLDQQDALQRTGFRNILPSKLPSTACPQNLS